MTDVFLSYKREDKASARALAEALARRGLDVWWDVDLLPGARFPKEIEQVIERAKVAVTLWSARSIHSDYIIDESRLAKERGILVPARLDASEPPLGFRTVQTEDLSAWDGAPTSPVIAGLVDAVARRAGKASEPEASDAETAAHLHGRDAEANLWAAINSRQPPSRAELRLFLKRYPDGVFADLAKLRLAESRFSPQRIAAYAMPVLGVVGAALLVVPRLDENLSTFGDWFASGSEEHRAEAEEAAPPAEARGSAADEGADGTLSNAAEAEGGAIDEAEPPAASAPDDDVAGGPAADAVQPADLADLATFTDTLTDGAPCGFCPEMVVIPAGTFTMGSPPGEAGRFNDEGPQREVRVERFALARTEVTADQFGAFVDATGHDPAGCWVWNGSEWENDWNKTWHDPGFAQTGRHPVPCVSWDDARDYVEWLSQATGESYRLPSEAEWEYAARAGTRTRYAFGDELSQSEANFGGNVGRTWEVGSGAANDWSLFDLHGNLWEWTEDCWRGSYEGVARDGSAWLQSHDGDCSRRVVRGGSWYSIPRYLRSALRNWDNSDMRSSLNGFRVARTLTP